MKTLSCLLLLVAVPASWDFDEATIGELPTGWTAAKTGDGPGSVWKVVQDKSKVLAQTSSAGPDSLFNLCIADGTQYRDLNMSVDVKAIQGKNDQGGGLVWRLKDPKNYYIARWNPLEDNFRVYHVVAGKRTQLANADVKLPTDCWHTVRVVHVKDHIRCYLDGKLHLDVRDETFADAGKIGLWSKSDAVSHFDNLTVGEPKAE
jgi:hypothetical protein